MGRDDRPFRIVAYIGTSLDGYIARLNGDLDWLTSRGEQAGEMGYDEFFAGIDTMVLGRSTYETVVGFGGDWPYAGKRTFVLSSTLAEDADSRIEVVRNLDALQDRLAATNASAVYADGGKVITSLIAASLLDEITVSVAPVLIGSGHPLFGPLDADASLELLSTKALGAGFTQTHYRFIY